MLIVFGGLPGTGKTTISRELALRIGAVHLRIDSIESALRDSGVCPEPLNDAGYRVAYAVAADNLRLGRTVIADSVNPLPLTRHAWTDVAASAGVPSLQIEVTCSDPQEHRRRVESRPHPTWQQVQDREYHPWPTADLVIDTANRDLHGCVDLILNHPAGNPADSRIRSI